jgi:hypothetical protein
VTKADSRREKQDCKAIVQTGNIAACLSSGLFFNGTQPS